MKIKNMEYCPKSRLKKLQDLTYIPYQDICKLIDYEIGLSKELFSNLNRDMAKELGLI